MLVIFPFEEPFYRERGVEAEFVGHPLAELPLPAISREQFRRGKRPGPTRTWIGLLPGSRPKGDSRQPAGDAARRRGSLAGQNSTRGLEFVFLWPDAECRTAE
jgi:hypothetical protein